MRPRQAGFGQQPGRLAATMLRALSAELSDPTRYSRGKSYARDGAVIDIEVRPGEVAGEVLGSRRDAVQGLAVRRPGTAARRRRHLADIAGHVVALIPDRTEIAIECTCPDAGGGLMCKHAIAMLLVFADEVAIEPELLAPLARPARRRTRRARAPAPGTSAAGRRPGAAPVVARAAAAAAEPPVAHAGADRHTARGAHRPHRPARPTAGRRCSPRSGAEPARTASAPTAYSLHTSTRRQIMGNQPPTACCPTRSSAVAHIIRNGGASSRGARCTPLRRGVDLECTPASTPTGRW